MGTLRSLRCVFSVLVVLLACMLSPADGQEKQNAPGAVTITSRTELVLVPVIVTEGSGVHITGLGKSEFVVRDNGVEQSIATLEEIRASSAPVHRSPPSDGFYTNLLTAGKEARQVNIIVIDTVNTVFTDQSYARAEIIRFLERSASGEQSTALLSLTRSGMKVVHDFTTDNSILIAALRKMRGTVHAMAGENVEAEAEAAAGLTLVDKTRPEEITLLEMLRAVEGKSAQLKRGAAVQATLDAFRDIALAYSGVPGRKALIWVTGSFPFQIDKVEPSSAANLPNGFCMCDQIDPSSFGFVVRWKQIMDELNEANIAIYPVDARGLSVRGYTAASTSPLRETRVRVDPGFAQDLAMKYQSQVDAHTATLDTMANFAAMTGGRAFYNSNDIAGAAERAAEDSAQYYVLAYYRKPKPGEKPGWHRLQVKVRRDHANVRTRSGYVVTGQPANDEQSLRSELASAVSSPFDFTGLPLWFRLTDKAPLAVADGKKQVPFVVGLNPGTFTIDAENNHFVSLEIVLVARDASMKLVDQRNRHMQANLTPETLAKVTAHGFTYQDKLLLPPGDYTVRVAVRDNVGGRMGSLQAPLKVE